MPELPEVETIRRDLRPHLEGRVITGLEILDPRWCLPLSPGDVEQVVIGREIEKLERRGKYLVWELAESVYLHVHLRMTGNLLLRFREEDGDGSQDGSLPPHTRVRFQLDLGEVELLFVDPRRFGTGEVAIGFSAHEEFLGKRLGVEPLSPAFTPEKMAEIGRGSKAGIKGLLLDQKRIAGIGNIYADEALFRARIHPLRRANSVSAKKYFALRDAIVTVLNAGIKARGASIDDYRDASGAKGAFQDQFLVHRREGEPCPRCGTHIRKIRAAGRGTYLCPRCQRLAGARS
jgi:formamidopyrimidine-DNA glycosylase